MSAWMEARKLRRQRVGHRPSGGTRIRGTTLWFWVFVGPFLIGLLTFTYIPILWSAVLSFFESRNTVTPSKFVGVQNYVDLLQDENFQSAMVTFTIFAVVIVPLTFAASLGMALLLHRARFAKTFFRSVFFLPTACSYVVACLIWKLSIFNGVHFGLANTVLGWFDIEPVAWLTTVNPPWYWPVIVSARLWLQLGFFMILFLAGLQRISPELYEAAYVDGAKPGWKTFRHITLPQLRPTAVAVLLLCLINAYQAFDEFYNLVRNIPEARPPLLYLYDISFSSEQDFGHGSAGALILALVIALVSLLQGKVLGFGRSGEEDRG